MEKKTRPSLDRFLSWNEEAGVSVVRFTDDILDLLTDLEAQDAFWTFLNSLEQSATVRAVLCVATRACFSPERCDAFWKTVGDFGNAHTDSNFFPEPLRKVWVHPAEKSIERIIRRIRNIPKPVIFALQGDVTFPFMGIALACETRVISSDTVFHNRCHEMDIPPGMALGCLLPLYVGFSRATTILMLTSQIDATGALELGLVERVVQPEELDAVAMEIAYEFSKCPPWTARAIKRLLTGQLCRMEKLTPVEDEEMDKALDHIPAT